MRRTWGMRATETEIEIETGDTPIVREVQYKLAKARELMRVLRLDALVLSRADSFAWITAGGDSRCVSSTDTGVASVLITANRQFVLTSNVEAERVEEEVTAHLGPGCMFETIAYPWHEDRKSVV